MDRVKLEALIKENPAVAAAAAMATIKLKNAQTGRTNKAITALRNKDNPSHGKAVGIFQKLKDKFKKSDFDKEKDKVAKGADDWVKKQSQSDADFYKKQYAARTGKELRRKEMKITEDALRKVIRSEIKKTLLKESSPGYTKREFGEPLPTLSGVMKQHQNKVVKEDEDSFSQPIPAQIDRYMKKFIDAVSKGNLNRKRKLAILGRTIVALKLDPQEVSKYARLVKREL
jgi:hypothetical protein